MQEPMLNGRSGSCIVADRGLVDAAALGANRPEWGSRVRGQSAGQRRSSGMRAAG